MKNNWEWFGIAAICGVPTGAIVWALASLFVR